MGKPVYLGKVKFYWCDNCNVPLVSPECAVCGSTGRKVNITPPGEVRIGFEGDKKILQETIEREFGCRPKFDLVLFNRVPHYDRMDEVIVDGEIIGNLRYSIERKKFVFSLRLKGAYLLGKCAKKGFVIADKGAIEPILNGKNLMVPGVVRCSDDIEKGDEIIVMTEEGISFACGIAKMNTDEMRTSKKGVAVKIRYSGFGEFELRKAPDMARVVKANEKHLEFIERKAVKFIQDLRRRFNLPMAVSFSGGKDSMAVLLLALKSGIELQTFFLDTGIEFPETVEYAKYVADKYELKMDIVSAGDAFWNGLEKFGPPGRDYRWCCKVCKLGPTTRYILKKYGGKILTLIGQRRYESLDRMRKGNIWKNEWVPNQISASPIQNWTSLEVWLYLLWKNAPINPWYIRGLTRIGCYLCPSSDLADFEIVKKHFPKFSDWLSVLKNYAKAHNADESWAYSAWRWVYPPKWAGDIQIPREKFEIHTDSIDDEIVEIRTDGKIDLEKTKNLINILPPGTFEISSNRICVKKEMKMYAISIVLRANRCIGCGICTGRCPQNALYIENGSVRLNTGLCVHCLECFGKCPAEKF